MLCKPQCRRSEEFVDENDVRKAEIGGHLHQVVLEEILQPSLRGRISEVSNVKSSTFSSAGDNSLILRGVDRLASSEGVGTFSVCWLVKGSVCHLGGGSFDGHDDVVVWKLMTRKRESLRVADVLCESEVRAHVRKLKKLGVLVEPEGLPMNGVM